MSQQMMNQSLPTTMGDTNQILPDETRYIMPPDAARTQEGRWVYGNPEVNHSGQSRMDGMGDYTAPGAMPGENMEWSSMPIQGLNGGTYSSHISSSMAQSQRMKNPVDMSVTHSPSDSSEAYQASLRSLLDRNIGYFVVCAFQVGTREQLVTWQGILHSVGSDYLVLYQPDSERYVSCDFYALKFVQFHDAKGVPYCASSRMWEGRREM